jgi:hypothetical protein
MGETSSNPTSAPALDPAARVSPARKDASGVLVHDVQSPFQGGTTHIRVLLPERMEPARRYRVMYVLPVEAGEGKQFGDGLAEVRKLGLHNTHQLICVAPTFSHLPWYADHPTDPHIRQEAFFLRVVVPSVEARYPARAEPAGRLLLGFSKSGWGAWSLLLRHPDVFARAAAWDAPMMLDAPGLYGSGGIFATRANFDRYRIPALLAALPPGALGKDPRLALLGYGNFRKEHQALHAKLLALKIPHRYADGPRRPHDWSSGWLAEAAAFLAGQ